MKIKFAFVNPGGNLTALVLTKVSRQKQSEFAKRIMKKNKTCEQVGFVEPAKNKKAVCRLQMMGGEFCGNALRALAVWLTIEKIKKENKKNNFKFKVETSGTKELIKIFAQTDSLGRVVSAQVNLPVIFKPKINKRKIILSGVEIAVNFIALGGISFFIIPEKYFNSRVNYKIFFKKLYNKKGVNQPACGLVFYSQISKTNFSIRPLVFVKKTNSLIYETSCASGSVALMQAKRLKKVKVMQPSGFALKLEQKGQVALVGGKVGKMRYRWSE